MIKSCPYCGKQPSVFETITEVKGVDVGVCIVECDNYEDASMLPFVEHRLSVYGKDKQQAVDRWNEVVPEEK